MTKAGPFLKMYSLYVQNFDDAMNAIKNWSEKSAAFNTIIQNIQKTPECNSLTLQVYIVFVLYASCIVTVFKHIHSCVTFMHFLLNNVRSFPFS